MGYCVETTDINLSIPAANLDEAYRLMCELNVTHDDQKRGGSFSGGVQTGKWFSWMDANYPDTCPDAQAIFDHMRFDSHYNDFGDLILGGFVGEKVGQEDLFFEAIGHLVTPGSYVNWMGEDGDVWRWEFDGLQMKRASGRIVWDSEV